MHSSAGPSQPDRKIGAAAAQGVGGSPGEPVAIRITPDIELAAAMRLVSTADSEREGAARRLLAAGPRHGIDFRHAWAVPEPAGGKRTVRQVCLAIPGSGKTAMIFISEPPTGGDPGGEAAGLAERMACIRAAISDMASLRDEHGAPRVVVAQALPGPADLAPIRACLGSGFVKVGELSYMRAAVPSGKRSPAVDSRRWPAGVEVVSVASIPEPRRHPALIEALDATYIETLDCPELCGMRETRDILESHLKTGQHDPAMWWLVFDEGSPRGCMLLSRCPDQQSVELVYLGLAPVLRGKGIARRLMEMALRATAEARFAEITCAVDGRNAPAMHLYESCGMRGFAQRVALVRAV